MINPIELAKKKAVEGGGGYRSTEFFSLKDGERKIVRFLTNFEPMLVISHQCGALHMDIRKSEWDAAMEAGTPFLCPVCGEPVLPENIEYERPIVEGALMHRFVKTSDPDKRRNFVCVGNPENVAMGIVPGQQTGPDTAIPDYQCPICASPENMNQYGKPKKPTLRLYGVVVEREAETEQRMVNGIPAMVTTGIKDVMVADEDGTVHPKVMVCEFSYNQIWQQLVGWSDGGLKNICTVDFEISRTGEKLDTTYSINCLNEGSPMGVDMSLYAEWMPGVHEMLSRLGDPQYYHDNGWPVPGFVPQPKEDGQQPVAQAQPAMAQPMQAPPIQNGYYAAPQAAPVAQPQVPQAQQMPQQSQMPQQPMQPMPAQPAAPGAGFVMPGADPQPPVTAAPNNWSAIQNQLGQQ